MLEQLLDLMGDDLNIVYRHFPLSNIHDKAILAGEASESAGAQDAFWEYHDLLYERQDDWKDLSIEEATETFIDYAAELGLDADQMAADLEAGTYRETLEIAEQTAREANLTGTPSIAMNGYIFPLQQIPLNPEGLKFFSGIIRLAENQFDPPELVIDPDTDYQATIITENGDIVIDLFADTAPTNVNSFIHLAQNGWYDNVTFHRVLEGFMAQAGDPSGSGIGWPGYRCEDEITTEHAFDQAGVVAMANSGANTNGGQFFITFAPAEHLNDGFTIIGQVAEGQDVVDSLTRRDPEQQPDFDGDLIETITISEK